MITEQKEIHYCDHGCGRVGKYYSKWTKKWRCNENVYMCPTIRENRRNIRIGKKTSETTKIKIGNANRGKKRSKEFSKLMSKIHKGRKLTPEQLKKWSEVKIKPHIFKDGLEYKRCGKCKKLKTLDNFFNLKRSWDKKGTMCKNCSRIRRNKWAKEHRKKQHEWRKNQHNRRKINDVSYIISRNLRGRVLSAIKRAVKYKIYKSDNTLNLVGCSIEFYIKYIESKFTEGMNWDEYMKGNIQIHHIKPCYTFDLTDPKQQKECFNYINTIPIWKKEHLKNRILLHFTTEIKNAAK